MTNSVTSKADPEDFDLEAFTKLLFKYVPPVGEDMYQYNAFRAGVIDSLQPASAYEQILAERVVALEWELHQHRAMRDACLRRYTMEAVMEAHMAAARAKWEEETRVLKEKHGRDRGEYNEESAVEQAKRFALYSVAVVPDLRADTAREIQKLGMEPIELASRAYRATSTGASYHEAEIKELERRVRDAKRDYDALVKTRPVTIEGSGKPVRGTRIIGHTRS
ncbi:hypothetical protein RAZWK3B_00035 [Roseobacter sp. AzwK-3b]|uniref:hypothetical protein n=1 Tax=Roseobacter sp. AzwK-3b TaxID=351016 RepID=UPI000156A851|nr:hypothetical protein [Roseobacter sp. AzwK-3b]EDM69890.1 hypothetical protein RAZWK3B_00035 [Roseobacter sp. AzwK-3b]